MKYLVKYSGSFGFIKPWSAVRDTQTQSCNYLTPSILMGIERKLFPELSVSENGKLNKIIRHRLSFSNISYLQECTRSIAFTKEVNKVTKKKYINLNSSIVKRGVLVNPILYLMFDDENDAKIAMAQHICLCRNEDLMLPIELIMFSNESEFDSDDYSGYETFAVNSNESESFYCGYNKYTNADQYVVRKTFGTPANLE